MDRSAGRIHEFQRARDRNVEQVQATFMRESITEKIVGRFHSSAV